MRRREASIGPILACIDTNIHKQPDSSVSFTMHLSLVARSNQSQFDLPMGSLSPT